MRDTIPFLFIETDHEKDKIIVFCYGQDWAKHFSTKATSKLVDSINSFTPCPKEVIEDIGMELFDARMLHANAPRKDFPCISPIHRASAWKLVVDYVTTVNKAILAMDTI
jgi:hypothetical protein